MKKRILLVILVVLVGAAIWYLRSLGVPTEEVYRDPQLDDFGAVYDQLETDERDCMKQKVGEARIKVLAEGATMTDTERTELTACIYY